MYEVFRHHDSARVGLIDGLLKEAGIATVLRNWTGSNITEVPIPVLYPNICVLEKAEVGEARRIIAEYLSAAPEALPDWTCQVCGATVDGFLGECWSCQSAKGSCKG